MDTGKVELTSYTEVKHYFQVTLKSSVSGFVSRSFAGSIFKHFLMYITNNKNSISHGSSFIIIRNCSSLLKRLSLHVPSPLSSTIYLFCPSLWNFGAVLLRGQGTGHELSGNGLRRKLHKDNRISRFSAFADTIEIARISLSSCDYSMTPPITIKL